MLSSTDTAAGPWYVLLVTSSVIEQKLLVGLLTKHQHRVFVIDDGRTALTKWSEDDFDVVIVDALVSELDAPELIRGIRLFEKGIRRVPIVILSENPADADRCGQAGADVCLSRPLQIAEFHEFVQSMRRPVIADSTDSPGSDSVDWKVALEAVGGRRDLLTELVDIFGDEYPTTLTAIRSAIDKRDAKGLQMSAHQLKGCLRYFGKTTASELARTLEDIGRSGQIDGAANKLDPLVAAVQRLLPQLRQGPN